MFPPPPSRRPGGSRRCPGGSWPAAPRVTCGRPGAAGMLGPERYRSRGAARADAALPLPALRRSCGQAALPARVTPRLPGSLGGGGISAWGSLNAEPCVRQEWGNRRKCTPLPPSKSIQTCRCRCIYLLEVQHSASITYEKQHKGVGFPYKEKQNRWWLYRRGCCRMNNALSSN